MLDALLNWLSGLPPVAIYGVLALLAAVENVFPPFPADTAIALGAFLGHRGVTNPWLVFVVTTVANIAGAMVMYALASRHAATLLESRIARFVLPPEGLERIRSGYLRYGLPGLFLGRILPGFRAVVAPFAGLIHLGAVRTLVPMTIASALWYGALVWIASELGNRLSDIQQLLTGVNRTLGVVSLLIVGVAGVLIYRRIRRRRALARLASEEEHGE